MTTETVSPPASFGSPESKKAAQERRVFLEFVRLAKLPVDPESVKSRRPPEPDVRCVVADQVVAFELVELCDAELAKNIGDQIKHGVAPKLVWGADVSEAAYRGKLAKTYSSDAAIELLCFSGRTAMPDEVVLEHLRRAVDGFGLGIFRRVWFLGHDFAAVVAEKA